VGYRLALALILSACNPLLPEPDPVPQTRDDVPCSDACSRLRSLSCDAGEPTPDGTTCEEICTYVNESGGVTWPTGCVAAAKSCAEAQECE
jgi:hypothetical protein